MTKDRDRTGIVAACAARRICSTAGRRGADDGAGLASAGATGRPAALVERRRRPSRRSSTSCKATTDQASPKFVPPEERIATFDQDGTLWVEHPMYTQVVYCLDRVPALVEDEAGAGKTSSRSRPCSPATARRSPSCRCTTSKRSLAATLTGMTVEEFDAEAKDWLATRQASALEAALHRADLSADAGGAAVSARQRLQDLHRHRRRPGFRARLLRAGLRHPARAGGRHRRRARSTATTRTASRS